MYRAEELALWGPEAASPLSPSTGPYFVPLPPSQVQPTPALQRSVPGSGMSQTAENAWHSEGKQGSVATRFLGPTQYESLLSMVRGTPEFRSLQDSQAMNRALYRQELMRGPGLDFATPLANLSDFVQTGRLGTRKDTTASEAAARLQKWASQLQDDERDIAKTLNSGMQTLKAGTDTNSVIEYLATKLGAKAADPTQSVSKPDVKVDRFVKTFQASPNVKPLNDAINSSRDMLAALNSPNWLSDTNVRSFMVEAARLKPVSDRDVRQYGGNPALLNRIEQTWNRVANGQVFRPEDRQIIAEYAQVMAKKNEAAVQDLAKKYTTSVGKEYGYSPEEGMSKLGFTMPTLETGKRATSKKPTPNIDQMILEALKH